MKKSGIIILLIIICTGLSAESNKLNSFFGVYGKKASVMGSLDGSAFEIWIYPYKLLHQYKFNVIVNDRSRSPYSRISNFEMSHTAVTRRYTGECWNIVEAILPALDKSCVFINYKISAIRDIEIEFSFKPDLQPMWPASIGGKYCHWNDDGYFVFSESSGNNSGIFGGIKGGDNFKLPAHKLPGGIIRKKINIKKGEHEFTLIAAAKKEKFSKTKELYDSAVKDKDLFFNKRRNYFKDFFKDHLLIETPVKWINQAVKNAILNVETAFVDNPALGEGLIAGYGLSGDSERPGFGWYFGGDGVINSQAALNYGDFASVKKEIEFLFKYQRKDGKIMHELSQSEGFVDWFKDYGFAFFHGDSTLYFSSLLDFYIKRTGDVKILKKHKTKIDKIYNWIQKCDSDNDGIVETAMAGTGASETGPLRQEMKTDILLGSLSVKAWDSLQHIYKILKDKKRHKISLKMFNLSKKSLKELFWNKQEELYSYAVKKNNEKINEVTIWPAVGMSFGVIDKNNGFKFGRLISTPFLSTDWGARILSSKSKYYNPLSYNNGSVWPYLNGFASLALYKYNRPYHGLSLLNANLKLIKDFDSGCGTELLTGDIYTPLNQSVPNQIWSSGTTITAFVEGLIGYKTNAVKKQIMFTPAIPLTWDKLKVDNLKTGKGNINLDYVKKGRKLSYTFIFSDLKGSFLSFKFPFKSLTRKIKLNGLEQKSIEQLKIKTGEDKIVIEVDLSGYLFPYVKNTSLAGDHSSTPVIENLTINGNVFILEVWGKGNTKIYLETDLKLMPSVGKIVNDNRETYLHYDFGREWQKKKIMINQDPGTE